MVRKTVTQFRRFARTWARGSGVEKYIQRVEKTTWWFLFIPVFSSERLVNANL